MRRGFYGGTFDPVHQGHVQLALFALQHCGLHSLDLIPCHLPPHRQAPTSAAHRVAMLELALAPYPQLQINDLELSHQQPSYTVDTLTTLKQRYPNDSLCFLIGMDSLQYFTRWHRWQEILELAHLLVVDRPGYSAEDGDAPELLARSQVTDLDALDRHAAGCIYRLANPPFDVSATLLRQNPTGAHPLQIPAVADYIKQHGLYCPAVG
ncbi:MAG TPA: nicotinate-nucleotide adenylyltransferase [Rheinheimera sp.]|nr:nicotinate-nucleotide adenylyltransferase [Rheinheimera sp.]